MRITKIRATVSFVLFKLHGTKSSHGELSRKIRVIQIVHLWRTPLFANIRDFIMTFRTYKSTLLKDIYLKYFNKIYDVYSSFEKQAFLGSF